MDDAAAEILKCIGEFLAVRPDEIRTETPLIELVTDSFALVELIIDLQDALGTSLTQSDFSQVRTVGDLIGLFVAHIDRRSSAACTSS